MGKPHMGKLQIMPQHNFKDTPAYSILKKKINLTSFSNHVKAFSKSQNTFLISQIVCLKDQVMNPHRNKSKLRIGLNKSYKGNVTKKQSNKINNFPLAALSCMTEQKILKSNSMSSDVDLSSASTSKTSSSITQNKFFLKKINPPRELKDQELAEKQCTEMYENFDIEALKLLVKGKKETLLKLQRQEEEILELTNLTESWKQAGLDGLEMLRKYVNPEITIEDMLNDFKIPLNLFF
ncbi:CLUMA_CG020281, isoform A [Clunio marinus]|uniref:CLUMA_CG020281, isoform A n=1 Tax=Clunio marinus TaxID=568069 RepID=A0A1J1J756_9DIPT|nr:CLUMA_CG020281, isoform A [Clunio marinus]